MQTGCKCLSGDHVRSADSSTRLIQPAALYFVSQTGDPATALQPAGCCVASPARQPARTSASASAGEASQLHTAPRNLKTRLLCWVCPACSRATVTDTNVGFFGCAGALACVGCMTLPHCSMSLASASVVWRGRERPRLSFSARSIPESPWLAAAAMAATALLSCPGLLRSIPSPLAASLHSTPEFASKPVEHPSKWSTQEPSLAGCSSIYIYIYIYI